MADFHFIKGKEIDLPGCLFQKDITLSNAQNLINISSSAFFFIYVDDYLVLCMLRVICLYLSSVKKRYKKNKGLRLKASFVDLQVIHYIYQISWGFVLINFFLLLYKIIIQN